MLGHLYTKSRSHWLGLLISWLFWLAVGKQSDPRESLCCCLLDVGPGCMEKRDAVKYLGCCSYELCKDNPANSHISHSLLWPSQDCRYPFNCVKITQLRIDPILKIAIGRIFTVRLSVYLSSTLNSYCAEYLLSGQFIFSFCFEPQCFFSHYLIQASVLVLGNSC